MNKTPLISVIVPVYNNEKYLRSCIESVLNQTFEDFELILVEDGSLDSSPKICDEYKEKDSRIKVIHQKNSGVSFARNAGLEIACGEYIMFIDSDDYIDILMLETMYKEMIERSVDCVATGLRYVFETTKTIKEYPLEEKVIDIKKDLDVSYSEIMQKYVFCTMCAKLYKHSIIDEYCIRFQSEIKILEDGIFVLNYFQHTQNCFFCEKVFYNYRHTSDYSLMKAFNSNALQALIYWEKASEWMLKYLNKKNQKNWKYNTFLYLKTYLTQIFTRTNLSRKEQKKLYYQYVKHNRIKKLIKQIPLTYCNKSEKKLLFLLKIRFLRLVFYILAQKNCKKESYVNKI